MTGPARLAVALTGLALVSPALPPAASGLAAEGPVEEARQAAQRVPFSARVEVSWVDHEGLHTSELTVRAVGGQVRIQAPGTAAGSGASTTVLRDTATAGTEAGGLLTPDVEKKYELVRRDGPTVAGRSTEQVVLRSGGLVRERLAIDKETGLVLQREVFGPAGRPVRVVRVLQLDTAPVPDAEPGVIGAGSAPRQLNVAHLPSAYPAPSTLAGGYRRVAAYRHEKIVHLLYTDGLHGLSVFSQPGELATGSLPRGGQLVPVGNATGVHYTWPGGEIVTWQAGAIVHTLVGDGSTEDLLAVARSFPRPGRPSIVERLLGTARLMSQLVSGGR